MSMLVFIDESGDPGFKLDQGASPIFVAAMVIFKSEAEAASTQKVIAESAARGRQAREFRFNKCSNEIRDLFFEAVSTCQFQVRAIVVRKEIIHSPRLQGDKERFYEFFIKTMMKRDGGVIRDAKVIIDGSGDHEFRQNLHAALRRKLGTRVIRDLRFKNSKSDVLLQLADMCAGAIARSYRERANKDRWLKMLSRRIDDVWEFR
jgi:hypothetical protein